VEKPDKPGLSECCGGGSCCPCVWDVYFEELQKWQEWQAKQDKSESQNIESDQQHQKK